MLDYNDGMRINYARETDNLVNPSALQQAAQPAQPVSFEDRLASLGKIKDYSGAEYDPATIVRLAQQIGQRIDPSKIGGGAFGTKGESIGFNYDEAKRLLGKDVNAPTQVVLDMARHLAQQGVTDLKDLKYGTYKPPEQTFESESGERVYQPPEQQGFYVGDKFIPSSFGQTYTGKGATDYFIGTDPKTGEPTFYTKGRSTSDLSPGLMAGLGILGGFFLGPALSGLISNALPGAAITGAGAAGAGAGIGFVPATAMNTALSGALSGGIMSGSLSALGGGSFGKGFLGGAAGPLVGAGIGSLLPTGMDPTVAKAITQGASSGVRSAIGGGDFGKGFLGGAVNPFVSDVVGQNLPADLSPTVRNAITGTLGNTINTAIRGGDVGQALLGGVLSGALNYGADKVADASTIPPQAINLASGILAPTLMGKKLDPITVMSALMNSANPYSRRAGATPYSR